MSKIKKIVVSVSNDLSSDQRVHRTCKYLHQQGFEVTVLGRVLKNSKNLEKREYKHVRFKLLFNKGVLFYFCLNFRIFFYLLFKKNKYLLANDLDTLPANFLVSVLKHNILFYDSHELFTEVPELINRNLVKKIWLIIEKICFKKIYKAYTVCDSIAEFYKKKYNVDFTVVRNFPYYLEIKNDYTERENILVYQGALNKDRGLELIIQSMQYIEDYKLIIIGEGDISKELKDLTTKLKLEKNVLFYGKLDSEKLIPITSKALLGLSLEQNTNLNYYYSLPNKIFDYINSGTPVLCSDFPEMKNIVEKYSVGRVFSGSSSKELAERILEILDNKEKLKIWHLNCIKASKELCWENESKVLKEIFIESKTV